MGAPRCTLQAADRMVGSRARFVSYTTTSSPGYWCCHSCFFPADRQHLPVLLRHDGRGGLDGLKRSGLENGRSQMTISQLYCQRITFVGIVVDVKVPEAPRAVRYVG